MSRGMIIGCFEPVSFPGIGLMNVIAKVDTGAYSGALHCTDIKVVRREESGQRILKFTPNGQPDLAQETAKFYQTYVRSALGHRQRRFVVDVEIELAGKTYQTSIGLSDRSDMRRPVLLGRRFLRENNILVDVRANAEYDDEGENTK